jgi:hypothetical protein
MMAGFLVDSQPTNPGLALEVWIRDLKFAEMRESPIV